MVIRVFKHIMTMNWPLIFHEYPMNLYKLIVFIYLS